MTKGQTLVIIAAMVVVAVAGRLVPHMPNFAPVTATALFCGAYMSRRQSFVALAAILLISDYLLLYIKPFGGTSFDTFYMPWQLHHDTLPFIYFSFGLSALVGWWVRSRTSSGYVVGAALFCSVQFFLISNAGVWAAGMYERGLDGLMQSYTMALPFFRGTVMGDLFYTAVFFGSFEVLRGFAGGLRGRVAEPATEVPVQA